MTAPSAAVVAGASYADWKHWEAGDFARFSPLHSVYYAQELARAGLAVNTPLDILELGFGNGSFLGWARERGHRLTGIETLAPALARARAAGIACSERLEDLPEAQRFDAVVAFDVFEHIPKPALETAVTLIAQRLNRGGVLMARFPNGGSPFGLHYQAGDLTHVTALATGAVTQLAAMSGLELVYCGAPCLPVRGVGVARGLRRALQRTVRAVLEALARQVYFDGAQVCLSPNLLIVLRRP
jgi:2-polyprenyl-3-methyl-5-hydroxy-6-metoxy-1,4-benzoquinol methylase